MDGAAYDAIGLAIFNKVVSLNLKASSLRSLRDREGKEDQEEKIQPAPAHLHGRTRNLLRVLGIGQRQVYGIIKLILYYIILFMFGKGNP